MNGFAGSTVITCWRRLAMCHRQKLGQATINVRPSRPRGPDANQRPSSIPRCGSVHPRTCGERGPNIDLLTPVDGSSPRMRGTAPEVEQGRAGQRFIPACAGNGDADPSCSPVESVHPRVCGERGERQFLAQGLRGSSPRVRGTVGVTKDNKAILRFIPACAGNGAADSIISVWMSVHPRVCGERVERHGHVLKGTGSSPRVRGTVVVLAPHDHRLRFIPACAGNGH